MPFAQYGCAEPLYERLCYAHDVCHKIKCRSFTPLRMRTRMVCVTHYAYAAATPQTLRMPPFACVTHSVITPLFADYGACAYWLLTPQDYRRQMALLLSLRGHAVQALPNSITHHEKYHLPPSPSPYEPHASLITTTFAFITNTAATPLPRTLFHKHLCHLRFTLRVRKCACILLPPVCRHRYCIHSL